MKTLRELCLAPESAAAFPAERLTQIEQALLADHQSDMPWYLRLIVGIGAWIASFFFLGFGIALIGWDNPDENVTLGTIGVVLLIAAVVVGRRKWGVFADQSALAVSLAAQGMIYFGFVDEHVHPLRTAMLYSILLAAVLYVAFSNFLSRLITCFAALQLTLIWIHVGDNGDLFSEARRAAEDFSLLTLCYWAFHLAGIGMTLLRPRASVLLAPLGYALIASLATWQAEILANQWIVQGGDLTFSSAFFVAGVFRLRSVLLGLTLLGVVVWAAGGTSVVRAKAPLFFGLVLVVSALIYFELDGVLLALLLVLIGFALQDRPVLGIGLILFPIFLTDYYYNLELDLLAKSGVLIGSGAIMLGLRAGLARWVFAGRKEVA